MARNRVEVAWHGGEFTQQLERAVIRGMGHGAGDVVAAARATPTRYRIHEAILAKIVARPVKRSKSGHGFWIAVVAPDWRSNFFEAGTLKGRRKKVSKATMERRNTPSGQARLAKVANSQGVKGQHFLRYGLRAGWPAFLQRIQQELPK